jgi:hypothetical protein
VTVSDGLASKPAAMVSPGLASKPVVGFLVEPQNQGAVTVSWFGSQNRQPQFGDLCLKITATVFWFRPQNQAVFGLSVATQNQRREVDTGHALRSSSLLHVEASRARVSQSGLKTGGCVTVDGARGTTVEVTSG